MAEDAAATLRALAGREVAPVQAPDLWARPGVWHPLSPRLRAKAVAGAAPLGDEGPRLALGAPPETEIERDPLQARPRYVVAGKNVLLAGQRALIDPGDPDIAESGAAEPVLVNDVLLLPAPFFDQSRPLTAFPHEFRMTHGVNRAGERLRIEADAQLEAPIDTPVVALGSTESRNYGSWLFRILPKLLLLDEIPEAAGGALLLPMEAEWMREIVAAAAPGRQVIAQEVTTITPLADVLAPSLAAPGNVFPSELRQALAAFAARLIGTVPSQGSAGRRLYVSRRSWSKTAPRRILVNEDEIVARLGALGFEEVRPESLSLRPRIAAFRDAEIVIGPSGSGLFNCIFCRPGTTILELEPHGGFRPMHQSLYRSLGLAHAFLRGDIVAPGPAPAHPNWRIEAETVLRIAEACQTR
ncbi:capsular polysaccharide biosynthesis protein [Rhodopseudomonas julia]|uniref:Capsular polysaccharide biosynthesis protein n=1 Tax=Rhodopseudomonas julia TaxID=200617 RepID=A0ABU0C3X3_9BRAD|nr:glycosyltransferase 61 family protein [Rhodopseudomonas julia]MDQ0325211.1 capsular polysaccharide biosynthesis protein [Rhodopseudomonas julia]